MTVFIQTNRFVAGGFYSNAATRGLQPAQDSFALIQDALHGARSIFRPGPALLEGRRYAERSAGREDGARSGVSLARCLTT
jgi:hypothetical protein